MLNHALHKGHNRVRTSSNPSNELHGLDHKHATSVKSSSSDTNRHVVPAAIFPGDTPETISLASNTKPSTENPTREVFFPHARPSGLPGTVKCVGRPDRPPLKVNTDVPIVSIPRITNRYGTPWRSAAPARYGPSEMSSAQMSRWLKGTREEQMLGKVLGDSFGAQGEEEPLGDVGLDGREG